MMNIHTAHPHGYGALPCSFTPTHPHTHTLLYYFSPLFSSRSVILPNIYFFRFIDSFFLILLLYTFLFLSFLRFPSLFCHQKLLVRFHLFFLRSVSPTAKYLFVSLAPIFLRAAFSSVIYLLVSVFLWSFFSSVFLNFWASGINVRANRSLYPNLLVFHSGDTEQPIKESFTMIVSNLFTWFLFFSASCFFLLC